MFGLHPLKNIIVHLKKGEAASRFRSNSSSEKVVIVNKLKQEILPKVPLFDGPNLVYLLVRNSNDASSIAEYSNIAATVNDFTKTASLICLLPIVLPALQVKKAN